MSPVARASTVLVLSPLLLISQAVGAALRGRGIDAEARPWSEEIHHLTDALAESDLVLLFDDLEDRDAVLGAQALVARSPARFLVLTHRPEGAAWGAMLAAGAAAVMSNESSLAEVEAAVHAARVGRSTFTDIRRAELVRTWLEWLEEDNALRARMAELSPREREVLQLLSQGLRVGDIVADLGVAETTVRSHIRAIRRKLDVGSQLAAVAVVHRLGGQTLGSLGSLSSLGTIESARPTPPSPRRPEP